MKKRPAIKASRRKFFVFVGVGRWRAVPGVEGRLLLAEGAAQSAVRVDSGGVTTVDAMESPRSGRLRTESFQDVLIPRVLSLHRMHLQGIRQARMCVDTDMFARLVQREIENLEYSCGCVQNLVDLAKSAMLSAQHAQHGPGNAEGAESAAPSSSSADTPLPPATPRVKRKSLMLAEELAKTANDRAQEVYDRRQQVSHKSASTSNNLHEMD